MSSKFPIGVATTERLLIILFILFVFIYIISCAPVNLSNQDGKSTQENTISEKLNNIKSENRVIEKKEDEKEMVLEDVVLDKTIIALFANDDDVKIRKQFINTYELAIYNLNVQDITLQIEFFETDKDLINIVDENLVPGRIFIGPIQSKYTKVLNKYCDKNVMFFDSQ